MPASLHRSKVQLLPSSLHALPLVAGTQVPVAIAGLQTRHALFGLVAPALTHTPLIRQAPPSRTLRHAPRPSQLSAVQVTPSSQE